MDKEAGVEAREVGALIAYSGGFIASYGQDMVFVFEQIAADTGEEFNFKCIKRIKFPKVLITYIYTNFTWPVCNVEVYIVLSLRTRD